MGVQESGDKFPTLLAKGKEWPKPPHHTQPKKSVASDDIVVDRMAKTA
jgi:hypothetical protein